MTSTMKSNSIRKEFEDVALLRHARSSGSEQARGCELAVLAPVPEGGFAPLYGVAERALGNVVGRLDPWIPYKGKQSLGMVEKEPSQCTDFSVGAVQMAFRQREEFLLQWDRLLDQLVAIEVAVAKSMPEPKEPGMQRQSVTGKAIRDRGPGELLYSKQVSFQVGPTKLGDALVVLDIGAEAVGAKDAQELRSQQLIQHFRTAALGNRKEYEATRNQNPEPAFRTGTTPASFIPVEDGFVSKLLLEFLMTSLQGRAGLFDRFLCAAETDRDGKYILQQFLHLSPGHAADDGQIRKEGCQLRPEVIEDFPGNRSPCDLATIRTNDFPELVLHNVGADFRKIGNLMSVGLARPAQPSSIFRKSVAAVPAAGRQDRDHFVCPFGRNQGAMTSRVPFLSAWFAPGFFALRMNPSISSRSVRRRWFRRVGRVLLSPSQLVFKIGDFFIALGNLFFEILEDISFLFKLGNLFFVLGHLCPKILVLLAQAVDFPPKSLEKRNRARNRGTRRGSLAPVSEGGRDTHPPYRNKFRMICPA